MQPIWQHNYDPAGNNGNGVRGDMRHHRGLTGKSSGGYGAMVVP